MLLNSLVASGNFNPLYINTFNKTPEYPSLPLIYSSSGNKLLQDSVDTLIVGFVSPTIQQKKNLLKRDTIGKGVVDGYVQELEVVYPYCKVFARKLSQFSPYGKKFCRYVYLCQH